MKIKKVVLAIAIFGGVMFAAEATNIIDLNEQSTTEMDKRRVVVPGQR